MPVAFAVLAAGLDALVVIYLADLIATLSAVAFFAAFGNFSTAFLRPYGVFDAVSAICILRERVIRLERAIRLEVVTGLEVSVGLRIGI